MSAVEVVKTAPTVGELHRSQVELPIEPNSVLLLFFRPDGTLSHLRPTHVATEAEAQHDYDTNLELQELLARAEASPTVRRKRRQRNHR